MVDPVAFTINIGDGAIVRNIYWYGLIIAAAMLLGLFVAIRNTKRIGKSPEIFIDFAIFGIVFAILGARMHYVIWAWDIFKTLPFWKIFAVWEGGLSLYGGLLGGILAAFIYSRVKKTSFLGLLDITAPSLILGQSIAKWGNFTNQEAFGYPVYNEKFWHFPITVFIQRTNQYHLATFFYESMWNLLGFIILMVSLRKSKREGKTFFLYMIIYGIGRIIVEGLRVDSQMLLNTNIRVNQVFSAIFIVIGGALYLFYRTANDYALVSKDGYEERRTSKPGKIRVKKVDTTKENSSDEYKSMANEMRKQREVNLSKKEHLNEE